MKKLFITLLTLIPLLSISQNKFAVFGGLNSSVISDGFLEQIQHNGTISFHIGGLYEYEISDKLVFRPKLVFSQQGDREKTTNSFKDANDIDYKLSYLNIPLNIKIFKTPYVIAGPQIGFLLSTEKLSEDFGDIKSTFDFGINLGIGYDIKDFFIELNFYEGLTTIIELEQVETQSLSVNGKNTVLQLSFGYYF